MILLGPISHDLTSIMDVLTGRGRSYMLESYGFGLCDVRRGDVVWCASKQTGSVISRICDLMLMQ